MFIFVKITKNHIYTFSFLEQNEMLRSSSGLPLGMLLFTSAFQSRKPGILENKSDMRQPFLL